jgi:hypothetical protein
MQLEFVVKYNKKQSNQGCEIHKQACLSSRALNASLRNPLMSDHFVREVIKRRTLGIPHRLGFPVYGAVHGGL